MDPHPQSVSLGNEAARAAIQEELEGYAAETLGKPVHSGELEFAHALASRAMTPEQPWVYLLHESGNIYFGMSRKYLQSVGVTEIATRAKTDGWMQRRGLAKTKDSHAWALGVRCNDLMLYTDVRYMDAPWAGHPERPRCVWERMAGWGFEAVQGPLKAGDVVFYFALQPRSVATRRAEHGWSEAWSCVPAPRAG